MRVDSDDVSVRQRLIPENDPNWDPDLPYGGKVYFARRKKPDPLWVKILEVTLIIIALIIIYFSYYHFESVHFNVTKLYAHMGFKEAQHQVGQRYLHGKGVDLHHPTAMHWFRKAANQGHPHASYNLAVGKLKGIPSEVGPGELKKLLDHAAKNGVNEAHHVLNNACAAGKCED